MAAQEPPYLLRVVAKNYRSLRDVDVSLGPLTVLVGPNGAGKSTFLDVIAFLGDSARHDLGPALERRGGFESLRFRGQDWNPRVEIRVETAATESSTSSDPDVYDLRFRLDEQRKNGDGRPLLARDETITFRNPGGSSRVSLSGIVLESVSPENQRSTMSLSEDTLALATLPKLVTQEGGVAMAAVADLLESFRVVDIDVAAARQPSARGLSSARLRGDAANLGLYLQRLSSEEPEVFERLEQEARHFIPGLQQITFRPTAGAVEGVVTQLVERGLDGPIDLGEASFGSIRALALLAVLHDPAPPRITCIEEIDHGLHPYVLDRLVELLRDASQHTQLLVATHSPALVNRLHADELIVCERDADGSSRIPAIPAEDVRAMEQALHGELELGELWFTGALGGVPQG